MMLVVLSVVAAVLAADKAQDVAGIDFTIAALNNAYSRASLCTQDAVIRVDFENLIELHTRRPIIPAVIGLDESWTILTIPQVVSGPIRFTTPDIAEVQGASRVANATTLVPRVPLYFTLKKQEGRWRISAVRLVPQ